MFNGTEGIDKYVSVLENALNDNKVIWVLEQAGWVILCVHTLCVCLIGYDAYFIGDTTTPRIDSNSIVIFNSSSEKLQFIYYMLSKHQKLDHL